VKQLKFMNVIKKSLDQYLHVALARGKMSPFHREVPPGIKCILLKKSLVW
jgi:hypothetical protein